MSQNITESSSVSQSLATNISLVTTEKYYCPFLERGFCRDSSRCNFSHDCQASIKIPTDYCRFYLANQCLFGLDCKFIHGEPDDNNVFFVDTSSIQTGGPNFSGDGSDYDDALNNNNNNNNNNCSDKTSTTILSRLKLPTNTAAQSLNKISTGSTNTGKSSTSPNTSKSSWQGARLIANIRNNFGVVNQASCSNTECDESNINHEEQGYKDLPMCPYSKASGECPFPEGHCNYLHGLVCDLCYSACLHPFNEEQRHQHREECLREHEREMELSFAVQRSKDKVCGICMDMVVEKKPITSSRFGILEKCNHIFCLDCIRKWRGTKQFDSRTIRACPECRVSSDFVVPSKYWVEDQDDKDRLINDYKVALKSKPCRYFNEGKGECPFAGSCFYKHAYPDGRLAVMEAPKPRRRLYGARGSSSSVANLILWNILTSTDEDDLSDDAINDDEILSLYDFDGYGEDFINSDDEMDPYWARDYDEF